MAGGVFVAIGVGLMVLAVALPFLIFNTESEDGGEAFGSVIVGIVVMFGVSPILFITGVVLAILGIVRWRRHP